MRVWDVLMFEGIKTLFRFGLGVMKVIEKDVLALKNESVLIPAVQHVPEERMKVSMRASG